MKMQNAIVQWINTFCQSVVSRLFVFLKTRYCLYLICLSVSINLILGILIFKNLHTVQSETDQMEFEDQSQLPFLSPRIFLYDQNDLLIHFVPLRKKLMDYQKIKGDNLGFYFEYLPTGTSIGLNEKKDFVLASLLKVPLAMAVFSQIEDHHMNLTDILVVQEKDLDPFFGDLWKKGAGTKVTVQEALELCLEKSDNTAKNVLFHAIPTGSLEDVFDALDIPKDLEGNAAVVTPKNYTSVLRSLYLSSYLEKRNSNQILEYLTKSSFDDKLKAGVPKDVTVAHKIGVIEPQNRNVSAYTDCGIIYLPRRPYALCLMARTDEETARQWMKDISTMVYEFVSTTNI